MEISEIETAEEPVEEFNIKIEAGETSVKNLGEHLGKLLNILEFTGIQTNENRTDSEQKYILDIFQRFWYPTFLHGSLLYLWYATISGGKLDYSMIIDLVLPLLPSVMWLLIRRQKTSFKLFLADLSAITSKHFTSHNRCLLCTTNVALSFLIVYPILLITMRILQGNVINVKEVFRILQEAIFPCTVVITYTSICYLLLQNLRFFTKMFHEKLDLTCSRDVKNAIKEYLDVVKNVEMFEKLFCNVAFVVVLHNFFVIAILVMDIKDSENWMSTFMLEALSEMIFIFVSLGMMTICAGNISLEMATIKSVLLDKMFIQSDQVVSSDCNKCINMLLKKDVCTLTASKAFSFDRGFLFKALATVVAQVVVIYELGLSLGR
ncbi:hypothetical protein HNY73_002871 [Argiope bruennichi]|uniref:Uncharacterized protein n=1 Tax=Argiope bruennichi TaxID=94029 RepID=A0A8T0FV30_ARGBR|nr:hypothetical protein HNY73_002871 [Argiope bruennichi]